MMVMRFLDLVFLVAPEPGASSRLSGSWMYVAATLGIGGVWLWVFSQNLRSRSLLPVNDPQFEDALAAHSH